MHRRIEATVNFRENFARKLFASYVSKEAPRANNSLGKYKRGTPRRGISRKRTTEEKLEKGKPNSALIAITYQGRHA